MDVDDFNQLSEFVFDQSTPDSDGDVINEESIEVPPPKDFTPRVRIIRRRARKACVACHKRKVRCDVLSRGHTCTNCRLDGITCVIRSGGKRQRGEPPAPVEEVPAIPAVEIETSRLIPPTHNPMPKITPPLESPAKEFSEFASPAPFHPTSFDSFPSFNNPTQVGSGSDMDLMFSYYDFLEAETLSHIAPDDFKFLEYKGCFHLPSRPILNDLVREYFLHIHPVLPLLDERVFWQLYFPSSKKPAGPRKLSLFVFRAMLFVSCSFVSDDTIRRLGFQSAVEARSCMYRRAKLLFDFDTTSDPMALSQGCLLLTYYSSDREPLANTSWLRLAIQYANSENVPMYDQDPTLSCEERLIRKRLWWCCIMRDRILPLGVRRSIQITRDIFDFSQSKLSEQDLEPEFGSSRVYDRETKADLARIFLAQLDLAIELTDAISYVYPMNGFRSFDRLDYNTMISMPSKIQKCKESLDAWYLRFKEEARGTWPTRHKSFALYKGLTCIYYQSARAALCQCESFMLQAGDSKMHEMRMKELGSELHSSVASISGTVQEFIQLNVAKYLPVSMVAYMALPIILNSLDIQNTSSTSSRTEAKRRQLRLFNEAMDLCQERYTGAAAASIIIRKTIEAARSEQDASQVQRSRSTSLIRPSSEGMQDWFEVFVSKPKQYLRISFTIDISLSMGRYPETEDLPHRLLLHNRLKPDYSIPKRLVPMLEEPPAKPDALEEAEKIESKKNDHLDYFDFNEPHTWERAEGSPWNGQTVDKILDEVMGDGGRFWAEASP